MRVFDFEDYRDYLNQWIQELPNGGFGQLAKLAKATAINPSVVTQVFKSEKNFTHEQAMDVCDHLELSGLECDYFLESVAMLRAGTARLKTHHANRLASLRKESQNLKKRIPPSSEMNEDARSSFYSNWFYSGVRVASSIKGLDNVDSIAERLNLSRQLVEKVLNFLLAHGLCVEKNGKIQVGPQSTHLNQSSILISRHHANWRLKGIDRMTRVKGDELFFTSPVSIASADIDRVRGILVEAIESCFQVVDPSPSQELACLNVDWFRF